MTELIRSRPVEQLPEPARFWIAYAPRNWRSAGGLWTDIANARLSGFRGEPGAPLPEFDADGLDDLFYLPPVVAARATARDRLAGKLIDAGTPVLIQLLPGQKARVSGAELVYDLLLPLLEGDYHRLAEVPEGATVVWPLISGLTDRIDVWDEGCSYLATAGARRAQAMVVELNPTLRRRLAEDRDEHVFDALFHGEVATEQQFAVFAARHGLEPFPGRPVTGHTPRQIRNRKIAAELALAGEIWLRLRKPTNVGQALFRAARGAEHTHHDLAALAREDNLSLMNWLDAQSAELVEEFFDQGQTRLLAELLDEYVGREVSGEGDVEQDDEEEGPGEKLDGKPE